MKSIAYVAGSDGTENASLMTVTTVRAPLSTEILVDTVLGVGAKFYGSMGTPHTFIDPVTNESITVISEATAVDFAGHINSGKVEIDAIAPGYTDLGSKVDDIIVIRPITEWANNIGNILGQSLNDDGSFKADSIVDNTPFANGVDPVLRASESIFNFVASGCVWTGNSVGSTRVGSMTAGIVYIAGKRLTVALVSSRTFTASKDTYVDFKDNGDGTASITYTEVTNNAASPALAGSGTFFNTLRNGVIATGTTSIAATTSINQGNIGTAIPAVGGVVQVISDSIGNLICNRTPTPTVLGYARLTGVSVGTSLGTFTPALVCYIPLGRHVKVIVNNGRITNTGGSGVETTYSISVDGTSTGTIQGTQVSSVSSGGGNIISDVVSPSVGAHTFTAQAAASAAVSMNSGNSGLITVELG